VTNYAWRVFPGEEHALAAVRRWLTSLLPDGPATDDVLSVATELGSNAVRPTASGRGGWFSVEITWLESALRVAVADCGGAAEPQVLEAPDGERGRGLLLVRHAKLGKHRLLPLHPTTVTAVQDYRKLRDQRFPRPASPALLVSSAGTRLLYYNFITTSARRSPGWPGRPACPTDQAIAAPGREQPASTLSTSQ